MSNEILRNCELVLNAGSLPDGILKFGYLGLDIFSGMIYIVTSCLGLSIGTMLTIGNVIAK